jgi:hypothetical protein
MSLSHKDLTTPFLEHKVELSPATKFFKKIAKANPAEHETVDFDVAITPSVYPQDIRSEIANIELALEHLLLLQKKVSKGNLLKGIAGFSSLSLLALALAFFMINKNHKKEERDSRLSHTFVPILNTTCLQSFQIDCGSASKGENFYNASLGVCREIAEQSCYLTGIDYVTIAIMVVMGMVAGFALSNIQGNKFESILKENLFAKKWGKTDFIKEILTKYKISLELTLNEIIDKLHQEKEKLQTDNEKIDEIKINYERRLS